MKATIVSALLLVLVVGIVTTSTSAFADNKCVPADGKSCIFNLKKGDVEVEDLVIGPFNFGSNTGGTVDQVARDGVTNASAQIVQLQAELQTANSNVDSLNASLVAEQGVNAAQAAEIDNLKAAVANLTQAAITDIGLSNSSDVVIPPIEPPIEPPVDNGTGNNSTNSTG